MAKHQLTLSPDYVQDWTYVQSIRELFQNALDNQTITPENEMYFDYNVEEGTLQIGNKTSILTLDTLLLGSSSKRDDDRTIGKHGEGYKVALMVLLRENKQVTIYNYGAKEIWRTRLVKSRKFNGAMITEIDVQKKAIFQSVPNHDLIIEVTGITPEEYEAIVESNLHLQDEPEKYTTTNDMGDILVAEEFKGHVYVNGLYVAHNEHFKYGYNLTPKNLKLDRDRKLVNTFDLAWETSMMWKHVGKEELVADLLMDDVMDVKYLNSRHSITEYDTVNNTEKNIVDSLLTRFKKEHGETAIPVSNNVDLQRVNRIGSSVKAVLVTPEVSSLLKTRIVMPTTFTKSLLVRMQDWLGEVESKLSEEEVSDFELLLEELKNN